ncbi:hypothetical protein JCM10449v2_007815 [Rhodotorula kratochvilovae]
MDLDALRKAALSSKKRKRTPQPAHLAPDDDEREEGEIDDDPAPPRPLAPLPAEDPPYQHYSDPYTHLHPAAYPPTPADGHINSASLHAVKEESKRIIAELLSYGVPPDYLLSIGISRDILQISFHELGLSLSLPPLYPSSQAPYSLPSNSLSVHAHPFTPRSSNSPAPDADLTALEALKRQELLARKAALKARNAQSAQSLESELEGLFSATSSAAPSPAPASPTGKGKKKKRERKKRKTSASSPAQKVHDLREAIDHTEEVVDVPSPGPFASAPAASASSSIAAASTRSTASFAAPSTRTRPLATDFEAEPASVLPPPSGARGAYGGGAGGMGFLAGAGGEGRMVIDLSDSDESGDEDGGEEGGSSPAAGEAALPSTSTGASASAPASKAPSPVVADAAEVERKTRLEEKEREIQRMMARIAEMERRKKEGKGKKPETETAEPSATEKVREVVEETAKEEERAEEAARQEQQPALMQEDEPAEEPALAAAAVEVR